MDRLEEIREKAKYPIARDLCNGQASWPPSHTDRPSTIVHEVVLPVADLSFLLDEVGRLTAESAHFQELLKEQAKMAFEATERANHLQAIEEAAKRAHENWACGKINTHSELDAAMLSLGEALRRPSDPLPR